MITTSHEPDSSSERPSANPGAPVCCGGPAPVGMPACCVQDVEAKAAGETGCGNQSPVVQPIRERTPCCSRVDD